MTFIKSLPILIKITKSEIDKVLINKKDMVQSLQKLENLKKNLESQLKNEDLFCAQNLDRMTTYDTYYFYKSINDKIKDLDVKIRILKKEIYDMEESLKSFYFDQKRYENTLEKNINRIESAAIKKENAESDERMTAIFNERILGNVNKTTF